MPNKLFIILLIAFNLVLGACTHSSSSAAPPTTIPIAMIASGQLAIEATQTAGGIWITDPNQLDTLSGRMLKGSRIPNQTKVLPEIDFSTDGVLLIWMGEKLTGGYAMELVTDQADIENHTVRIPVRWIEPRKGAIVPQMITNPYLLIRLARGPYDNITVVDPDGWYRLEVDAR